MNQPHDYGALGTRSYPGQSAYELACEHGYRGTIDEWRAAVQDGTLLELKGAKGETSGRSLGVKGDVGLSDPVELFKINDRRDETTGRFIGAFTDVGDLPPGKKRDVAVVGDRGYVHNGESWIVMQRKEDEGLADRLMEEIDKSLDPERADKEIKDTMGSPIVRRVVNFVLFILFGIFVVYSSAFYLEKELPQIEFLKHYLDQIVEVLKLFVG